MKIGMAVIVMVMAMVSSSIGMVVDTVMAIMKIVMMATTVKNTLCFGTCPDAWFVWKMSVW